MSTTTEVNADQLREQIAEHRQEIEQAEREIGVATLDGKSTAAATKRAREAREAIRRCEVALEELERREAEAAEEARTGAASAARLVSYEWMVRYLELLETYRVARAEFEAAEAALKNLQIDPKCRLAWRGGRSHSIDESDLDTDLLRAIPSPAGDRGRKGIVFGFQSTRISPERARELRGFAETRAEEERSGNGVDRSQPYGTWDRQVSERRKAERLG